MLIRLSVAHSLTPCLAQIPMCKTSLHFQIAQYFVVGGRTQIVIFLYGFISFAALRLVLHKFQCAKRVCTSKLRNTLLSLDSLGSSYANTTFRRSLAYASSCTNSDAQSGLALLDYTILCCFSKAARQKTKKTEKANNCLLFRSFI